MRIVAEGLEIDAAAITAHALAAPGAPSAADREAAIAAAERFVDDALVAHDAAVARRADRSV
jgi:hypothetical protein